MNVFQHWRLSVNKKLYGSILICSLLMSPSFTQKKTARKNSGSAAVAAPSAAKKSPALSSKTPTTTKSVEAKTAVDKMKKNPNPKKKDAVVVYNEDFEKGEELFQLNKPEEAILYFEKSLEKENVDPDVYVYLGVCYYQVGNYDKSLAICLQGLEKAGTDRKILAYNAGNSCYAMGNYLRADASYAIALQEDENYAPAMLNRANAQLKLDHLGDARDSYVKYLEMDTATPQKEKIEEIIRLLEEEIARRAKEKPELINPDVFVENEKIEIPVAPEKVVMEEMPREKIEKTPEEIVKFDSVAPKLPDIPPENRAKTPGEIVKNESQAPQLSEISVEDKKKLELVRGDGELVKAPSIERPVKPEKVGIDGEPPELPPEQLRLESPLGAENGQNGTSFRVGGGKGGSGNSGNSGNDSMANAEKFRVDDDLKRFEEENRLEMEALRLAEENARLKEEARIAEEKRKRAAEEEAERLAIQERKRAMEEELRQIEEQTRRAREEARAAEEAKAQAEARAAEEAKAQAEARAAEEAEARVAEEAKAQALLKEEAARQEQIKKWPAPKLDFAIKGADNFTPDGDGHHDTVIFLPKVAYLENEPESWELKVYDSQKNLFRSIKGSGKMPEQIEWDGRNDKGETVLSKNKYKIVFSLTPSEKDRRRTGKSSIEYEDEISTGLLLEVIIPGHEWKMVVNSLNFVPNGALEANKLTPAQRKWNSETLDEIAQQIKDHPGASIVVVEGYANNVSGSDKENREELLPLSKKRSDAIVEELVKRGVSREALDSEGKGGANPLAAHEDRSNWYKNRRVEFIIKK